MELADYTSYDEIRALLGVSDEELEDATLVLPAYSTDLELTISEVSTLAMPMYETIKAKAANDRTADEARYMITFDLFCSYAVAKHLLTSLPLFAYLRTTDGKAEIDRADRFEDVRRGVEAGFSTMKFRLLDLLSKLDPGVSAPVVRLPGFIVAAPLGTDPVTSTT